MKYKLPTFQLVSISLLVVLIPTILFADPENRLFDEGNLLYQQGDFKGACAKFHQIEAQGKISPELYYNLGNSYYKLNRASRAILYFERAHKLAPGDDDIAANLATANLAIVDRVAVSEEFQFSRFMERIIFFLPVRVLETAALILYYLVGFAVLFLIIQKNGRSRKLISRFLAIGILLLIMTLSNSGLQWYLQFDRIEAVIQIEEVAVMSDPNEEATEVFRIHEGTKVRVHQNSGNWLEIVLPDGKVGWVKAEVLETI